MLISSTNRKIILSVFTVICFFAEGGLISEIEAGRPKLTNDPIQSSTNENDSDRVDRLIQTFDGRQLTQSRAERMAIQAGFTLVEFYKCSFASDDCAMFQVVGRRGKAFRYQLSSERCLGRTQSWSVDAQAQDMRSIDAEQPRQQTRSAGSKPFDSNVPTTDRGGAAVDLGKAKPCFAGYKVVYRARENHSLYSGRMGFAIQIEHHWQIIENGRWVDAAVSRSNSWNLLHEWGGGIKNLGEKFELLDSEGHVLVSEEDSNDSIASSGEVDGISLQERCAIRAKSNAEAVLASVKSARLACEVAAMGLPDNVTIDGKFKALSAEVAASLAKNMTICAVMENAGIQVSKATEAATLDNCINNPGAYFPGLYPPAPDHITMIIAPPGFEPPVDLVLPVSTGSGCPMTYTKTDQTIIVGGKECSGDVKYECFPSLTGECECRNPKAEYIVCID